MSFNICVRENFILFEAYRLPNVKNYINITVIEGIYTNNVFVYTLLIYFS